MDREDNEWRARVVAVIGAGGGAASNGGCAALAYARAGAQVMAIDIDIEAARETAQTIEATGGSALALCADAASSVDMRNIACILADRFGRIDVLHNNVGIFSLGSAVDLADDEWDRVTRTNLRSLFAPCKHLVPLMQANGGGAIINVGSLAGLRYMGTPMVAYATSKGAVDAFTRALAVEYGPAGIRANTIAAGVIDTPLFAQTARAAYGALFGVNTLEGIRAARASCVPLRRLGSPQDIAAAALFLASDAAAYITGTTLLVDGGLSCGVPTPQA